MRTRFPRARLLAAAVLFSTGGAAIKSVAFSSWQVASFRSGIAAVAVLLLAPAARRGWTWRTPLVGVTYAATMVLFVLANKLTTAANTIFLQDTAPLYILLLSPLLLREPIRRRDVLFMMVVGSGLLLFFVGAERPLATAPNPFLGNVLAAVSGVTWAGTMLGLRWMAVGAGQREGAAVSAVAAGNIIACLVTLPLALPLPAGGPADWALLGYLGVFQIAVAYLFVAAGIREVPVFEASIILLVEPALNPIWAWLVHGEEPGVWALAGGVIIIGATTLKTWLDTRRARINLRSAA